MQYKRYIQVTWKRYVSWVYLLKHIYITWDAVPQICIFKKELRITNWYMCTVHLCGKRIRTVCTEAWYLAVTLSLNIGKTHVIQEVHPSDMKTVHVSWSYIMYHVCVKTCLVCSLIFRIFWDHILKWKCIYSWSWTLRTDYEYLITCENWFMI